MYLALKQLIILQEKEFVLLGLEKKKKCCEQDLLLLKHSAEELNNELHVFKQKLQLEEQGYKKGELQLTTDEETLVRQKAQLATIKKTSDYLAMEAINASLEERISTQQDALITQLEFIENLREEFALKTKLVDEKIRALKTQQEQLLRQNQDLLQVIQQQQQEVETFASTLHGKLYDAYCVLKKSGKAYPWIVPVTEKGSCSGCFLTLSTDVLSKLKEMNDPQFCEQCGRILYQKEALDA